jgi:hypothetical protein
MLRRDVIRQRSFFTFTFRSERERWIRDKYEQKLFLIAMNIAAEQARHLLVDAITNEDLETVIILLAHGKIPSDDLNNSIVHLAASKGNAIVLQLLLWVSISQVEHWISFDISVRCRCIRYR